MKIECLLTNPLLVEHVGPVLHALRRRGLDATFVSVPPARRFVHERTRRRELHERCVAAAHVADLPCFTRCDPQADVALTALGSNELHLYSGIKLKLRYGVTLHRAALHHNFAMSSGFDGLLAHGTFERALFSRWIAPERIAVIGVPRHAAYLARPLSQAEARAQLGLPAGGVAITYLPTWSQLSSLHSFLEPLCALARTNSMLVKPHALSLANSTERDALSRLERVGARLLSDGAAFAPLIAAADIVLADATSGAATEAALLAPDTPLALLSLREPTEMFREIEQLGPLVRTPHDLPKVVSQQLQTDTHRAERAKLRSRLFFADVDARRPSTSDLPLISPPLRLPVDPSRDAPELAADAILALAKLPKISGKPGLFERRWPRIARVARGRAIALAVRWAPVPPRDIA